MTVGIEGISLPEEQLIGYSFTDDDRVLLHAHAGLIDGLAELFGKHCEVVLHSLENLHESVIRIANGFNTGRTLGAHITDLALRTIMNQKMAKVMDEFQRLRSVTSEAVWFDPKGGTA